MTGASEAKAPTRLERAAKAFHEKESEWRKQYSQPMIGHMTRKNRDEELELCKLWAEYSAARNHPLLAALSTFEVVRTHYGSHELRFYCCVGERDRAHSYGGVCVFDRHAVLTEYGQIHPAVRTQIEEPIRQAERYIANAIDKERAARA